MKFLGNLLISAGRKIGGSIPLNVLHVAIAAAAGGAVAIGAGLLVSKDAPGVEAEVGVKKAEVGPSPAVNE